MASKSDSKATQLTGARVLVTGGTGFLGQYVCHELGGMGAEPMPVSKRDFDLRNEAEYLTAIMASRPDLVVHLAAPVEIAPPGSAHHDTLIMGMNAIRAASVAKARLVMVVRDGPEGSGYRAVRDALMALGRANRIEHKLAFTLVTPAPLYGPVDYFDESRLRPVPWLVLAALEAKKKGAKEIKLHGNPKRPFPLLYVQDAAKGVAMSCLLPGCHIPIELVPKEIHPLEAVASAVAQASGSGCTIDWDTSVDLFDPADGNGACAKDVLDWKPLVELKNGLTVTFEWLTENIRGAKK